MIPNSQHRLIVGDKIDPVWLRFLQSLDGKADASDIAAIATALGSPDGTVANIPDLSANTVRVLQGAGIAVTRGEDGEYYIALRPLGDSGAGTFKLITRDASGRISGSEDGSAADVPYDNTTSGLTATDAQAAVDELAAEKLGDAPSDGTTYGRKNAAWVPVGSGVAYAEGTSFPGSPSLNDKFYRTDLNLLCYYDGTRWLTVQEYRAAADAIDAVVPIAANGNTTRYCVDGVHGMYLTRADFTTLVNTTNTGSAYWTVTLNRVDAPGSATSVVSFNTSTNSPNTWVRHDQAINAVLDASALTLRVSAGKTGSPGSAYIIPALYYRLIVT